MDLLPVPSLPLVLHVLLTPGIAFRVIMRRPATGVALAWILLVGALPFVGAALYVIIGERRLSPHRAKRLLLQHDDFRHISEAMDADGLTDVDWSRHGDAAQCLDQIGRRFAGSPTVRGSDIALFGDTQDIFRRLIDDIDAAETNLLMEFYIWHPGGAADDVLDAVIRASGRGVACRLLIDALGAGSWWRSKQPRRLRDAGVALRPALPVGPLRTVVGRTDLRLHRKIAVIDGRIAWTGSMNLVDPRYFKQNAGVGQWIDAMARIEGPAVTPLAAVAAGDWTVETGKPPRRLLDQLAVANSRATGRADIQVIPSGPGGSGNALLSMLLGAINAAQRNLTITTPYLVPDDALLWALRGAAGRGVKIRVILPENVDSVLTRFASRSYYQDLMDAGIELFLYGGGMLHTKSLTVDDTFAMFGTVNFDMRSIWLNYEVALFVYDSDFTKMLRRLQRDYLADAKMLDPAEWSARPAPIRLVENSLRLAGPLL